MYQKTSSKDVFGVHFFGLSRIASRGMRSTMTAPDADIVTLCNIV